MATFTAPDGTQLAYRLHGHGDPVICLPGASADPAYLGDLGGLAAHRTLVMLDMRGTGGSAIPDDPTSYRCDRLVDDVEALREHLGPATIDLLAHSGAVNVATQYAARHPRNLRRLALIGPSTRAVGIEITGETRRAVARLRKDEPWFPAAYAALEALTEGRDGNPDDIAPFFWGRWDAAAREHHAASQPANTDALAHFGAEGAFDPPTTRAALADCTAPVLLLTGEYDVNSPPETTAELARLFPHATVVIQPEAGHYPWLDSPTHFTATLAPFLP